MQNILGGMGQLSELMGSLPSAEEIHQIVGSVVARQARIERDIAGIKQAQNDTLAMLRELTGKEPLAELPAHPGFNSDPMHPKHCTGCALPEEQCECPPRG